MSSRTPAGAVRTQSATAKSENGYDALQRRVWKKVYAPNGSGGWILAKTVVFTYDRWNVIMEKEYGSAGTLARTLRYTWGADVSGNLQGAGGVGGLLMAEEINGTTATPHYYCYDGNGNVTQVVDAAGNLEASHRYTAFGGNLESVTTTAFAQRNPWRFSTKYLDKEVETTEGLYYYGYRYYLTALGRWPSRDPIGKLGGVNLHGMVGNDTLNIFDALGLADVYFNKPYHNVYSGSLKPGSYKPSELLDILYPKGAPPSASNQLSDGCIGFCRLMQPTNYGTNDHNGNDLKNPESGDNAHCFHTEPEARQYGLKECPKQKATPFLFAKEGDWLDGKAPPQNTEIPKSSYVKEVSKGQFNYITYMGNDLYGTASAANFGAALLGSTMAGRLSPRYEEATISISKGAPNPGGYPARMWCVSCEPCK